MAQCLFRAVPEIIVGSAIEGSSVNVIVKMFASEGLTSGTFTIQSLESWITISLGSNLAKIGLEQDLTTTLSALSLKPGKFQDTLRVSWPTSDGQSCVKNIPVVFEVASPRQLTQAPSIDPRASSVLFYTRELISSGWTQGAAARDINGLPLEDPKSDQAVSWCLTGALERSRDLHSSKGKNLISHGELIVPLLKIATKGSVDLASWNDAPFTTRLKVLESIDGAIQQLSKQIQSRERFQKGVVKSLNDVLPKIKPLGAT